jgi:hypothetical protein
MKKCFFIIALITVAFTSSVNAQFSIKPGVRGGLNFTNITNSNLDSKTDFYVGGLLALKFAERYTLQPELIYSRQGAQDYGLDFLSLGIINKFKIVDGFHAVVGPTLDFKVGDDLSYNDDLIGFDFGITGGLGYSLPNGLTFEARFKQGFIDIFGGDYSEDADGNLDIDQIYLNQLFQLGVSYTFDLKK